MNGKRRSWRNEREILVFRYSRWQTYMVFHPTTITTATTTNNAEKMHWPSLHDQSPILRLYGTISTVAHKVMAYTPIQVTNSIGSVWLFPQHMLWFRTHFLFVIHNIGGRKKKDRNKSNICSCGQTLKFDFDVNYMMRQTQMQNCCI